MDAKCFIPSESRIPINQETGSDLTSLIVDKIRDGVSIITIKDIKII